MAVGIIVTLIIIFIIIIASVIAVIKFGIFKKKDFGVDPETQKYLDLLGDNPTIALNLMPNQSEGHAVVHEAYIEGEEPELNGDKYIYCFPRDINIKNAEDKKKLYKLQRILVRKGCKINLPKGMLSQHKNISIYTPYYAGDLPTEIQNTAFGRMLSQFLIQNQITNETIEQLIEQGKNKNQLMKMTDSGEIMQIVWNKISKVLGDNITAGIKESVEKER